MSWFRKPRQKLRAEDRRDLPSDVFNKCPKCGEIVYQARLEQNHHVCPTCGYYRGRQVIVIEERRRRAE